jgi:N6-adenosine-specific RNA methylase IME4/DNA-binding XRE family transcriptional regulator
MQIIIDKEFQSLIPPLTAEEYEGLEKSILAEGCRDALVLWGDILVDGHNRYEICTTHDVPFQTVQKDFADRNDALRWIILNQFGRRNLPAYERARLALRLKPVIAEKAKAQQVRTDENRVCQISDKQAIDTKRELAKAAGVSHDTIAKVEKIERQAAPEVKEQLRKGELSINQAYQTVRREEKKQEVQQRIEEHAAEQTGVVDIQQTDRKYNIIYADPPWRYWESGNKNQALHYTTMTIDEICDLPVKNIADDDCVLFLWVTYPILHEAFRVIESWGFKYSTAAFVWVKKNKQKDSPFMGCGAWTRANSELCLLATKGNIMRLDASISQVVESPIEEHSKKPDIVRDLITRLVGELPRVELFCRNPAKGWDVWGNEA